MSIFDLDATTRLRCNAAPTESELDLFRQKIDFSPDNGFLELIAHCNGAEGFVTDQVFLQVWTIQQILELNPYYEDVEVCNDLYFFGSDGSNLGFAFDKVSGTVVSIDFLDLGRVEPHVEGASFADFLTKIALSQNNLR